MNWFTDQNKNDIDSYINSNFYGVGVSETCGINMRLELEKILKDPNCGRGHWIAYRRYNRLTKSDEYIDCTKEGVGGPASDYTDTAIITRRVPLGLKSADLEMSKAGVGFGDAYIYYFEYNVSPKRGDHIFELNLGPGEQNKAPDLDDVEYVEKYQITATHPWRLHKGRIEYWGVIVKYDEVNY